jgi:hypothetical protein
MAAVVHVTWSTHKPSVPEPCGLASVLTRNPLMRLTRPMQVQATCSAQCYSLSQTHLVLLLLLQRRRRRSEVLPQVIAAVELLLLVIQLLAAACDRGVLLCIMLAVSSTLTAPPLWAWRQCRAGLLHLVGVLPPQRCWSVSMCSSQPRTAPFIHMHRQSHQQK